MGREYAVRPTRKPCEELQTGQPLDVVIKQRFVVKRQIRGSAVGCMLHVNARCRQVSTMDFRELTPHTIQ
ncbi:hypothetical protein EVAR_54063_1 [Eumeta japonica]|uniref:Uncharacterized protein n=1 Tax=Eumeta variegata TaxID=151549 RepID=A0A4C1XF31_EUMVA|nr:hypothetical protein EVAR_54063_1 [Eumeta japonica]